MTTEDAAFLKKPTEDLAESFRGLAELLRRSVLFSEQARQVLENAATKATTLAETSGQLLEGSQTTKALDAVQSQALSLAEESKQLLQQAKAGSFQFFEASGHLMAAATHIIEIAERVEKFAATQRPRTQ